MKTDMTYNEIDLVKNNINDFLGKLHILAEAENDKLTRADESFFTSMAKYIIFCKYLEQSSFMKDAVRFLENVISDSYYLILSLIKKEKRYMYVNERSIIENNIRIITYTSIDDNHFTNDLFKKLKTMTYNLNEKEYSLLRNEYRVACDFIHGGKLQHDNLSFVLEECLKKDIFSERERNTLYSRILNVIRIFNYMLIAEYPEQINGCFHRRKTLLGYLVGNKLVDYLFQKLNN